MQARAFNPQIFLELLCFLAFAALMLFLVLSGKYLSYVTPRMEPYLWFSAIVMALWAFIGLGRLFRPQHKLRSSHCFVLAVPILLLVLPHSPLSTADLSGSLIGGSAISGLSSGASGSLNSSVSAAAAKTEAPAAVIVENADAATEAPAAEVKLSNSNASYGSTDGYANDLPGLDVQGKKITVPDDYFGAWISEICMNMNLYEGYTVVMTGFVFKDPTMLKEDEFVPARLMMSCCVADLSPAGLLCKYDKVSELEAESWVTVEGTLFIGKYEFDGQFYDDPQISVTKITPAQAIEAYSYPF
ncbi:MAG: TIGR03943 family protein [Clostridiales bacterium]|jgi:putative membrane protein|nr:TIGR03943 family protein [Clostridiales bacterium]